MSDCCYPISKSPGTEKNNAFVLATAAKANPFSLLLSKAY
jgi:hypothetical protein